LAELAELDLKKFIRIDKRQVLAVLIVCNVGFVFCICIFVLMMRLVFVGFTAVFTTVILS